MRIAQTLEWYTTAAHGDVDGMTNNEWSDPTREGAILLVVDSSPPPVYPGREASEG